nr:hypothetical protein [Caldimonas sp.]
PSTSRRKAATCSALAARSEWIATPASTSGRAAARMRVAASNVARALAGGAAAAGQRQWGLVAGARADALVVDVGDPALRGIAATKMLDALVFSSPTLPWRDVMVAGRWRIRAGRHRGAAAIARRYAKTIEALSGSATARPS